MNESSVTNNIGAITEGAPPSREDAGEHRPSRKQQCRFFSSKSGCRSGASCPFRHDASNVPSQSSTESRHTASQLSAVASSRTGSERQQAKPASLPTRTRVTAAVARPVSDLEKKDPRAFQIQQILRRYPSATEQVGSDGASSISFELPPSDPDFPFDIGNLQCTLKVPANFPNSQPPQLRVSNSNIERGYQINIESGFDSLWTQSSSPSLFGAIKALDKQLEDILMAKKSDTIKITRNLPSAAVAVPKQPSTIPAAVARQSPSPPKKEPSVHRRPQATLEEREAASQKRRTETHVLEHRLKSQPHFSRSSDGLTYIIPFTPRKANELPAALKTIDRVRLLVPLDYDLVPCWIELLDGGRRVPAPGIEVAFESHAEQHSSLTLLAHVNWLSQNLYSIAKDMDDARDAGPIQPVEVSVDDRDSTAVNEPSLQANAEGDRSHIRYIPRPPEWAEPLDRQGPYSADDDEDDESSSFDESTDGEHDASEEDRATEGDRDAQPSADLREKGTLLSFPYLELYGVELLELVTVNLSVKCSRCREIMDVHKIQAHEGDQYVGVRSESCKKCAFAFGFGYRKDLMHANSIRAGYLDLDGCTPMDLLPSTFLPTCSTCSTTHPRPGVNAVRGDVSIAICRECHGKMSFKIPEVKFLHVGVAAVQATRGLPLKKKKESLGIVAGQPLPKTGRCKHYGKSYRWFRFSCCNKVFPCDRCHDEANPDHPNEFATRMLCGYCSREQNYRPEDCGVCKAKLTGKKGSGFWEGGKGTRDKTRMSRKDPRKFKRRPGTKPAS